MSGRHRECPTVRPLFSRAVLTRARRAGWGEFDSAVSDDSEAPNFDTAYDHTQHVVLQQYSDQRDIGPMLRVLGELNNDDSAGSTSAETGPSSLIEQLRACDKNLSSVIVDIPVITLEARASFKLPNIYREAFLRSPLTLISSLTQAVCQQTVLAAALLRTLPPVHAEHYTEASSLEFARILVALTRSLSYLDDQTPINAEFFSRFFECVGFSSVWPHFMEEVRWHSAGDTDEGGCAEHRLVSISLLRLFLGEDAGMFKAMHALGITVKTCAHKEGFQLPEPLYARPGNALHAPFFYTPDDTATKRSTSWFYGRRAAAGTDKCTEILPADMPYMHPCTLFCNPTVLGHTMRLASDDDDSCVPFACVFIRCGGTTITVQDLSWDEEYRIRETVGEERQFDVRDAHAKGWRYKIVRDADQPLKSTGHSWPLVATADDLRFMGSTAEAAIRVTDGEAVILIPRAHNFLPSNIVADSNVVEHETGFSRVRTRIPVISSVGRSCVQVGMTLVEVDRKTGQTIGSSSSMEEDAGTRMHLAGKEVHDAVQVYTLPYDDVENKDAGVNLSKQPTITKYAKGSGRVDKRTGLVCTLPGALRVLVPTQEMVAEAKDDDSLTAACEAANLDITVGDVMFLGLVPVDVSAGITPVGGLRTRAPAPWPCMAATDVRCLSQ